MKNVSLNDLLEAGSHFGHQKRRWNPKMKRFIYGERDGVHVFDLVKTKSGLEKACEYLERLVADGGIVLFVGTKRQAAELVVEAAKKVGMPYVGVRWMGGLLTNYGQLSGRIKKLIEDKKKREAGEFKRFTKKEQLLMDRQIAKLEKFFGGLVELEKLPDALFVVDTHREEVAVAEAVKMKIPVVGIVDSNADPDMVDYPIPANDDAVKSIELIVSAIGDAIEKVQSSKFKVQSEEKDSKMGEVASTGIGEAEEIEEKLIKEEEEGKNKLATKKAKGEKNG